MKNYVTDFTIVSHNTDVSPKIRDNIIDYLINKYGRDNVSNIATFSIMQPKIAIQDVCRVFGINPQEVIKVTKKLIVPDKENITCQDLKEENPHFEKFLLKYKKYNLEKYIDELIGNHRNVGIHAAGIIVSSKKLTDIVPLMRAKKNIVTAWQDGSEGRHLSAVGLIKLDLLGLNNLQVIQDTIDLIKKRHNKNINIQDINIEDEKVYKDVIQQGNHYGIFQFECIEENTTILKYNNSNIYIKDLQIGEILKSYDIKNNKIVNNYVIYKAYTGEKEVYELKTKTTKILATLNHKFLYKDKTFKFLEELDIGDEVFIYDIDNQVKLDIIISIKKIGIKKTYDLTMYMDHRNYIANRFIVHNSPISINAMKKIMPNNFEELAAITSLIRPGPSQMGMIDEFADRKFGNKPYKIPDILKDILEPTYGILIYQEQIQLIANRIGGFDKSETNDLRKFIVKLGKNRNKSKEFKEKEAIYKTKFVNNASKHIGKKQAEYLWEAMIAFAGYGFNKCIEENQTVKVLGYGEIKLKELSKLPKPIKIASLINNKIQYVEVLNIYNNGIKNIYEITFDNEYVIQCTLDHKFETNKGLLPLKEINKNQKILGI